MPGREHPHARYKDHKDREHRPLELLAFRLHRRHRIFRIWQHMVGVLCSYHLLYHHPDPRGLYCIPYLKQTRGSVINFASGAGLFGKLGQASYAAAKEGIRGMSRVAAAEWGPDGVRVNVICPLAMTESLQQWRENFPELYEKTIQGIPLGHFADPKGDIGRVCVFLASEDAEYVTGETITLQGGSGLRP